MHSIVLGPVPGRLLKQKEYWKDGVQNSISLTTTSEKSLIHREWLFFLGQYGKFGGEGNTHYSFFTPQPFKSIAAKEKKDWLSDF
jgi:hypothetical protein